MLGRRRFSTVNPQPAHLFMICSNIKLTSPKESIVSGGYDFREESQWDRRNLRRPSGIEPSLAATIFLNGDWKTPMTTASRMSGLSLKTLHEEARRCRAC